MGSRKATGRPTGRYRKMFGGNHIFFKTPPYKPHNTLLTFSNFTAMGNLLYIIAVILIIVWALGFFGILGTGIQSNGLIHILLVIAIIAILFRVISGRNAV